MNKFIKLNNWYITGLTDAEGCFIVNIIKDNTRTTGYNIQTSFELNLNHKDLDLLKNLKYTLGVGNIYYNSNDKTYKYKVSDLNNLINIIIPQFKQYRLLTHKYLDFIIFSKIMNIIKNKEHLSLEGLQEILKLKTNLNLGLSKNIKKDFPNLMSITKPNFKGSLIPDPNWLYGFSEGESCFYISIYNSKKSKLGKAVQLVFKLTQHSRDIKLLKNISKYLDCGRIEERKGKACDFTVTSLKYLKLIIIPFFSEYKLQGSKLLDFNVFKEAVNILDNKLHLEQ